MLHLRLTHRTWLQGGGYFQHSLFNEHTKGGYKDLSYLNRDLRHVIIVDTNPESYGLQKYNGVAIKPWDGDLHDTELLNLVPFLEAVFKEDIQDVREVGFLRLFFYAADGWCGSHAHRRLTQVVFFSFQYHKPFSANIQ